MRRRGRRTIGIRGEELVGVLYGVGGSRMWMMVQPVVLPSLRILLEVVGLAVHREERRGGRKTGQAKPQNATSLAAQTPALPTRCRVAVTLRVTLPFSALLRSSNVRFGTIGYAWHGGTI